MRQFAILIAVILISCNNPLVNNPEIRKLKRRDSLLKVIYGLDSITRLKEARELYIEILEDFPGDTLIFKEMCKIDSANKDILNLKRIYSKDTIDLINVYNTKKIKYRNKLMFDSCIYFVNKIVAIDSTFDIVIQTASWLVRNNQHHKALNLFGRYSEVSRIKTLFYLFRSQINFDIGNYETALSEIKVVKNELNSLEVLDLSCGINLNLKNYRDAIKDAEMAISYKKNKKLFKIEKLRFAKIYSFKAIASLSLGDYASASKDAETALKLDENSHLGYLVKASYFYEFYKYDSALVYINKSLNLNNNFKDSYYVRSSILKELKRYDQAMSDAETLNKLDSLDIRYYNLKARIYQKINNYKEAKKYYEIAFSKGDFTCKRFYDEMLMKK
jgi:hypothetical protein